MQRIPEPRTRGGEAPRGEWEDARPVAQPRGAAVSGVGVSTVDKADTVNKINGMAVGVYFLSIA
jgi:hypothetical protein